MTYQDLLLLHKDDLRVTIIKAIDNKSMSISYSIYTNLHIDLGIVDNDLNHFHGKSRSKFNRELLKFLRLFRKSPVLTSTNNDENYTRLIYTLKK